MLMEDQKLRYLQNFLQHNQNYCLKDYIQRAKSWEDEARNCYDKQIGLNSDQFAEMMLLDGISVIQLFLMFRDHQRRLPNDQIFGKPWKFTDVCHDMALLENQIPFFVVQKLFEMAFGTHQHHMLELLELVCLFFKRVMRKEKLPEAVMETGVKHFVHAISLSFLPSVRKTPNENHKEMKFSPSVTELMAAGSKCLFDIEFENGVLGIPFLLLDDLTETDFRNILAFEQCYCKNRYLVDCMAFMSHLVDTLGDAELLINKGIIENCLSSKEAAVRLISTLSHENRMSRYYNFNSLSHKLVNHCQRPNNKWKATFKRDYCSNPWVVISVIAAGVLLLLTVAQTVFSALSLA
ncbi:hypothetical protein BT93_L0590 [Corymbia citriodora subsp. variegata]|uniref:Uncharacterized protein n=1 Tax=Corymbia citriodora subsp. variegata TaxID=360336 RepID=A0A8T0CZG1_CORYI|nr:hypothetical protein BT93_L0590 [Corymbia citriodora subsp. variegata]